VCVFFLISCMFLLPRGSILFPYTTLFRSDRSRARRCVEACVYGTLDFVGYPRFPAPVEFIAAVIAYYVHPVNIQTACLNRSRKRSEERFSRNAETDLVCRLLLEKKKHTES